MYVEEFKSDEDVAREFGGDPKSQAAILSQLKESKVLLAWYAFGGYEGEAFVLFEKDGILYEVNGSHCSFYGLEGQWDPQEVTWQALSKRNLLGDMSESQTANKFLQNLCKEKIFESTAKKIYEG